MLSSVSSCASLPAYLFFFQKAVLHYINNKPYLVAAVGIFFICPRILISLLINVNYLPVYYLPLSPTLIKAIMCVFYVAVNRWTKNSRRAGCALIFCDHPSHLNKQDIPDYTLELSYILNTWMLLQYYPKTFYLHQTRSFKSS